jgi:N-acetylmuramoyl-L-alanine amidase
VVVTAMAAASIACAPSGPATAVAAGKPLVGTTIVLDPGHNGGNGAAPSAINRQVGIGQGQTKACNTTGTATNSGYPEAAYTWDVAVRARRVLRNRGASARASPTAPGRPRRSRSTPTVRAPRASASTSSSRR